MDIRALVGTNSPPPLPHFDPEFPTSKAIKVQLLNTVISHTNASLPHFSMPRVRAGWSPNREQAGWLLHSLLEVQPETREAAVGVSVTESRDSLGSETGNMWERDGELSPVQFFASRLETLQLDLQDRPSSRGYNKTISKLVNSISPGRSPVPTKPKSARPSARRPNKPRPRPLSTRPTPSPTINYACTALPMKVTGRPWLYPAPLCRSKTAIAAGRPESQVEARTSRTASATGNHRGLSSGTDLEGMTDSFSPLMLKPRYGTAQNRNSPLGEVRMIEVKLPTPKFRPSDIQEEERRPHSALELLKDWEQAATPPIAPEPFPLQPPPVLSTPYIPEETEQSSPDKMSLEAYLPPRFTIIPSKRSSEVPKASTTDLNSSLAVAVLRPARSSLTAEPGAARTVASNVSLLASRPLLCLSPGNVSDLINSIPSGRRPRSGIVRHGRLIKGKVALEGVRSSGRAVRCVHLID